MPTTLQIPSTSPPPAQARASLTPVHLPSFSQPEPTTSTVLLRARFPFSYLLVCKAYLWPGAGVARGAVRQRRCQGGPRCPSGLTGDGPVVRWLLPLVRAGRLARARNRGRGRSHPPGADIMLLPQSVFRIAVR